MGRMIKSLTFYKFINSKNSGSDKHYSNSAKSPKLLIVATAPPSIVPKP